MLSTSFSLSRNTTSPSLNSPSFLSRTSSEISSLSEPEQRCISLRIVYEQRKEVVFTCSSTIDELIESRLRTISSEQMSLLISPPSYIFSCEQLINIKDTLYEYPINPLTDEMGKNIPSTKKCPFITFELYTTCSNIEERIAKTHFYMPYCLDNGKSYVINQSYEVMMGCFLVGFEYKSLSLVNVLYVRFQWVLFNHDIRMYLYSRFMSHFYQPFLNIYRDSIRDLFESKRKSSEMNFMFFNDMESCSKINRDEINVLYHEIGEYEKLLDNLRDTNRIMMNLMNGV